MQTSDLPPMPPKGPDDRPSNGHLVRLALTEAVLVAVCIVSFAMGNIVLGVVFLVLSLAMAGFVFAIAKAVADVVAKRHANVFRLIARYLQPDVHHRTGGPVEGDDPDEVAIDKAVGFGLTRAAAEGGFFSGNMPQVYREKLRANVFAEREATYAWLAEAPGWQAIGMESWDGAVLEGHVMLCEGSRRWAVLCHGYAGTWDSMIQYARRWHEAGYNLLLPTMRGHGQSEGAFIGMGYLDRLDVVCWCRALVQKELCDVPADAIALMGHSMGSTSVNLANAEEDLPAQVRVVVSDCGFTSVWNAMATMGKTAGIPVHPTADLARFYLAVSRGGYDVAKGDVEEALHRAKAPTLFVHGLGDETVPPYMMRGLVEACAAPCEHLLIEGAGHCQSSLMDPDVYWEAVLGFAERHMR